MNYYDTHAPTYIVNVLGTEYQCYVGVMPEYDRELKNCDGYHDKTIKRIVVVGKVDEANLGDWNEYSKSVLRHELLHAFMHESGIDGNYKWDNDTEHPEGLVSWMSLQFPKILKAFREVDAL